jgi:hypothetical protein
MNFGEYFHYFYTEEIYKAELTTTKNEIGQEIHGYTKGTASTSCDVQPIDEKDIKYTWGNDIESRYKVFCDESFEVGDVIIWRDKVYEIEKIIDWIDYKIYAIKSSDEEVV